MDSTTASRLGVLIVSLAPSAVSACRNARETPASVPAEAGAMIVDAGTCPSAATVVVDWRRAGELEVTGDIGNGIFDPSELWPSGSEAGFLSYSTGQSDGIFTRIARTTDGQTFTYLTDANKPSDLPVTTSDSKVCGSTVCPARIVHETSSLVFDPTEPDPLRRYKLFDYSYAIVPSATPAAQHAWGYIGLYAAAKPDGPWSEGTKALGWHSTAPGVSSDGVRTQLSNIPDLADCAAFTEPAALVPAGGAEIDLALGCVAPFEGGSGAPRSVLLRSIDHGASFTYAGLLLSVIDGNALGSTVPGVQPSDLFQQDGVTYLVASTAGVVAGPTQGRSDGYTSCVTVAIDDMAAAKVHRDSAGAPSVVRKLVAPDGLFAGACSYKPEFAAGYLVNEVVPDPPRVNRMYKSGIPCP